MYQNRARLPSFNRPEWSRWHMAKVRISGADKPTALEISKYIKFSNGQSVSYSDCVGLEKKIIKNMPRFESVSVNRNFFNKELVIKITKYQKIALMMTDYGPLYLASKGALFADNDHSQDTALITVTLKGKIKSEFLPKEFVELVKELNNNARGGLRYQEVLLDLDGGTFSLKTQQISAQMGPVQDFRRKIKALTAVVRAAAARNLKAPYSINLKYFNDGKIYLTPTV